MEEVRIFKNKLSFTMERIIESNYRSIEKLVKESHIFPFEEVRNFLEQAIERSKTNKISFVALNAYLKFAYLYLNQDKLQFNFKNLTPIPICYFSSYLLLGASFLYSYLKSLSFDVRLFSVNKTDDYLREFIEEKRPSMIIFTISQFLHVERLKKLIPYLLNNNLEILIGGIPFNYDKDLKNKFPKSVFPRDMNELVHLLEDNMEKMQK